MPTLLKLSGTPQLSTTWRTQPNKRPCSNSPTASCDAAVRSRHTCPSSPTNHTKQDDQTGPPMTQPQAAAPTHSQHLTTGTRSLTPGRPLSWWTAGPISSRNSCLLAGAVKMVTQLPLCLLSCHVHAPSLRDTTSNSTPVEPKLQQKQSASMYRRCSLAHHRLAHTGCCQECWVQGRTAADKEV
jgi:hypothetical protein